MCKNQLLSKESLHINIAHSPMRISTRKTPAAVLRFILGQKLDDDFCKLVGCSIDLWRKLENGDRKITERVAAHVESTTGVTRVWLLAGNPKAKPVAVDGSPFTLEYFRAFQAAQLSGKDRALGFAIYPAGHLPILLATAVAAGESGKLASFAVELDAMVSQLQSKFGWKKETAIEMYETMGKNPDAYFFEVSDNAGEHRDFRVARHKLALDYTEAGAIPTWMSIQKRPDGKEWTVRGHRRPNLPFEKAPRSARGKAKP